MVPTTAPAPAPKAVETKPDPDPEVIGTRPDQSPEVTRTKPEPVPKAAEKQPNSALVNAENAPPAHIWEPVRTVTTLRNQCGKQKSMSLKRQVVRVETVDGQEVLVARAERRM